MVVAASSDLEWGLWVLSFSATLEMTVHELVDTDAFEEWIRGATIGRFDPPPDGSDTDFNQQIAVLFAENTADGWELLIDIYTVDPPDFTPTKVESARTVFLDSNPFTISTTNRKLTAPLQAGDLQGRSLRLGPPEKATVVHTQIDTVLGMPPMHVDYITPPDGSRVQLNESYVPRGTNGQVDPTQPRLPDGQTEWVVPTGTYFVMGDNRTQSQDSRVFGPIEENLIVGRAWLRYFPLDHVGFMERPTYEGLQSGDEASLPPAYALGGSSATIQVSIARP